MAKKRFRHIWGIIRDWALFLFLLVTQLSLLAICWYRVMPAYLTPFMLAKGNGQESEWVSIEQMSPNIAKAVLTSEDPKFLKHFGFDFENIAKSIEDNMEDDKKLRGASTVSQQMVKNLFLWPSRSYIRKGLEAYLTIWVEAFWPKRRIMEVYLNIIETGKGIYGVELASQKYFKRPASKLNRYQSALLIACLPNPVIFRVDKPSIRTLKKVSRIEKMWKYSDTPPAWWYHAKADVPLRVSKEDKDSGRIKPEK